MHNVVKVMFPVTKVFSYFDSNDFDLGVDDIVIVETEFGMDFGIVKKSPYVEESDNLPESLGKIIRKASEDDKKQLLENQEKAEKALEIAKKYSKELELNMSFVDCCYTFDRNQLIFFCC